MDPVLFSVIKDIFICKWLNNQNMFEIMNAIKTHIETFTKGALCFDKSILFCNKKSNNKDEWLFSFVLPEEKENHLRIFNISKYITLFPFSCSYTCNLFSSILSIILILPLPS